MMTKNIENEIRIILKSLIPNFPSNIQSDKSLSEFASLDSLSFLHLVVQLEQQYNVQIDDDLLIINNFDTIQKIISVISELIVKR